MCDAQVKNQGNVSQVGGKLDVSTSLPPALSHLLSPYCVGCPKQKGKLLYYPVMVLLGSS
jgi:hypothetical protein